MDETPPTPITFPRRPSDQAPALVLPKRHAVTRSPFSVSAASAAARESIRAIVSATRAPFPGGMPPDLKRVSELERQLRQLENSLTERERIIEESEVRASDRQREIAEMEALLAAREQLLAIARKPVKVAISAEEKIALEKIREELERQDATLKEGREVLRGREAFLDESETKLFEKVQAQQEKEIELDQREEDLRARERRIREREAALDPQSAASLRAEDAAAAQRDEFKE